jgi:hypothetical protein
MSLDGLLAFASPFIVEFEATRARVKEKLKDLEDQYCESRNFPRKKKKKVRKYILSLYSIMKYGEELFDKNSLEGILSGVE